MDIWDKTAIVGIGATAFTLKGERSEFSLAAEACKAAIEDAGLPAHEVDGITSFGAAGLDYELAQQLGLRNQRFQAPTGMTGSLGAPGTVMLASMAVASGMANYVLAFRAINARSGRRLGQSAASGRVTGQQAFTVPFGAMVPGHYTALRARRHMHQYGTESRHFGAIAVACRKHANRNPKAISYKTPLTLEDHQSSRVVADPLHLFDYCLETDGACAVLVTTAERARSLRQPPAYILSGAWGAGPPLGGLVGDSRTPIDEEPAVASMARELFGRAGITPKDIDTAQIYDHFSPLALMALEGLGFCKIGEGGPFVEGGRLEWPDGDLPLNTAGGNLAEGYVQAMNHVCEAVRQIRGTSTSQVKDAELVLVDGAISPVQHGNAGIILRR